MTPAAFLASLCAPEFKSGNTLPPLTRWGWSLSFAATVQLARWGYALDFGDVSPEAINALAKADSPQSKMAALALTQPDRYRLLVTVPRSLQDAETDPAAFLDDARGQPLIPHKWSPEAPDRLLSAMGSKLHDSLGQVRARAPVAVILDGGERGLGVPNAVSDAAKADAKVLAAKGDRSWSDYVSDRKAYQEAFLSTAARDAAPAAAYIYYPTGDQYSPQSMRSWDWDYRWMKKVPTYPSGSFYYREFNSGWAAVSGGQSDLLSQALNAHAYDTPLGAPLSYNWVNDGYSTDEDGSHFGDETLYVGFLKSAYTAGMIGGIAGYFSSPKGGFDQPFDPSAPPHWLTQMLDLARVHAEFSYLEDMLRQGELLAGPLADRLNPRLPGYEFPTGNDNARVLIRQRNGEKRWLISAWAADGVARDVVVAVPTAGGVKLRATPAASLYDLRIVAGHQILTVLDPGVTSPAPPRIPASRPDAAVDAR